MYVRRTYVRTYLYTYVHTMSYLHTYVRTYENGRCHIPGKNVKMITCVDNKLSKSTHDVTVKHRNLNGSAMPPTPTHSRNFSTFSRSRSTFSSRTARQIFSKSRSGRRDRFRQKIVKIGAILAIFGPFEIFRSFAVIFWPSTSGCDGSSQFLRAAGAPVRRRGAAGAPAARKN